MVKQRRGSSANFRAGWAPTMEQRAGADEARQVKCLTADAGHMWMHYFDPLPPVVRRRLAESCFNICPACMDIEAHKTASHPTVETYFTVIKEIEQKLTR
jgi:hypothetical protein